MLVKSIERISNIANQLDKQKLFSYSNQIDSILKKFVIAQVNELEKEQLFDRQFKHAVKNISNRFMPRTAEKSLIYANVEIVKGKMGNFFQVTLFKYGNVTSELVEEWLQWYKDNFDKSADQWRDYEPVILGVFLTNIQATGDEQIDDDLMKKVCKAVNAAVWKAESDTSDSIADTFRSLQEQYITIPPKKVNHQVTLQSVWMTCLDNFLGGIKLYSSESQLLSENKKIYNKLITTLLAQRALQSLIQKVAALIDNDDNDEVQKVLKEKEVSLGGALEKGFIPLEKVRPKHIKYINDVLQMVAKYYSDAIPRVSIRMRLFADVVVNKEDNFFYVGLFKFGGIKRYSLTQWVLKQVEKLPADASYEDIMKCLHPRKWNESYEYFTKRENLIGTGVFCTEIKATGVNEIDKEIIKRIQKMVYDAVYAVENPEDIFEVKKVFQDMRMKEAIERLQPKAKEAQILLEHIWFTLLPQELGGIKTYPSASALIEDNKQIYIRSVIMEAALWLIESNAAEQIVQQIQYEVPTLVEIKTMPVAASLTNIYLMDRIIKFANKLDDNNLSHYSDMIDSVINKYIYMLGARLNNGN